MNQPLWEIEQVSKAYPGVLANDAVSLRLMPGRIHGLLGENGCGKSTLIRMLSGVERPDRGQILCRGRRVQLTSPQVARAEGVATVFQEFSSVGPLSVAENIFLGRWPRRRGLVDWHGMESEAAKVLARLAISLDPRAPVSRLSVAEQQLVEIAKAVAADASLIILDEPTTALGLTEIDRLHGLLRRMRAEGHAILYVSHRLDEVTSLVDEVTILRAGRVVAEAGRTAVDIGTIVRAMIGTEVADHYPKARNATAEILLQTRDLRAKGVRGVDLTLHRGEVLGLGGVLGSGRTEIARALFGATPASGEILLEGRPLRLRSPADAIAAGLALVTENRKSDGLFFNWDAGQNMSSASLRRLGPWRLRLGQEAEETGALARALELTRKAATVRHLSGGNQQKAVIGRWLMAGARVLILDEPTQGIDIGARMAVYRLINEATARGCGVILISSDHDELLAMSDRVAVIRHGQIAATRLAGALTPADLVQAAKDSA